MEKNASSFSKKRIISYSHYTERGKIPTNKNKNDGYVEYESLGEATLIILHDHDPNCIAIESQPIQIPNKSGIGKPYTLDLGAKFKDGKRVLFDVKHHTFFENLEKNSKKKENWEKRKEIIQEYCNKNSYVYQIVTDNELYTTRQNNVEFFRNNKIIPTNLQQIKPSIDKILSKGDLSCINLGIEISRQLNLDIKEIMPTINHLIYHDYFMLDFETKIDDETVLCLKSKRESAVLPLYQYFQKIPKKKVQSFKRKTYFELNPKDPNYNKKNRKDFLALSEKIRKEIMRRINLLKVFQEEDLTTEKLKDFAKKNNVGYGTLYRWRDAFTQKGWVGLIPQYHKRGKKKENDSKRDSIAKEIIEEKYNSENQPPIMGAYEQYLIECEREGIEPFHYDTFRKRIYEISDKERILKRRGKKVAQDQYRPLLGKHPYGKHPLDVIEFDHTELDVKLLDRERHISIGSPWLTIGFDIYSRMVYGYYLSLDEPSYLSLAMTFRTGILQKDEIAKKFGAKHQWSIYGIPKRVTGDNAKEFVGNAFENFCLSNDIIMDFNPVKKPERKPFVERFFKTLNESINKEGIGGYRLRLAERKKTGYDPEKKAVMTFTEFEEWFVKWLVDTYHMRPHSGIEKSDGIKKTPSEKYEEGLAQIKGRTVGLPQMPQNIDQLYFDVLPFDRRQIHRYGIKKFAIEYHSTNVARLFNNQSDPKEEYIIRYDPRDIREIYLWVEQENDYYVVPMKSSYSSRFKVNPQDPTDTPLSLKELEAIKKHIREKRIYGKRMSVSKHELVKGFEKRQKLIEDAIKKTKDAKRMRKKKENLQIYSTKATASQIREKKMIMIINNGLKNSDVEEDKEIDLEKIKERLEKKKFSTKEFPKKSINRRY